MKPIRTSFSQPPVPNTPYPQRGGRVPQYPVPSPQRCTELVEVSPVPSKSPKKLPLYLFLAMCFNLVVAPVVYAAAGEEFSRSQAWALGLLGIVTLSLCIYLFFVMFIPEKF